MLHSMRKGDITSVMQIDAMNVAESSAAGGQRNIGLE
jgi:hypothetical protein